MGYNQNGFVGGWVGTTHRVGHKGISNTKEKQPKVIPPKIANGTPQNGTPPSAGWVGNNDWLGPTVRWGTRKLCSQNNLLQTGLNTMRCHLVAWVGGAQRNAHPCHRISCK